MGKKPPKKTPASDLIQSLMDEVKSSHLGESAVNLPGVQTETDVWGNLRGGDQAGSSHSISIPLASPSTTTVVSPEELLRSREVVLPNTTISSMAEPSRSESRPILASPAEASVILKPESHLWQEIKGKIADKIPEKKDETNFVIFGKTGIQKQNDFNLKNGEPLKTVKIPESKSPTSKNKEKESDKNKHKGKGIEVPNKETLGHTALQRSEAPTFKMDLPNKSPSREDDRTLSLQELADAPRGTPPSSQLRTRSTNIGDENEKTLAVEGFANPKPVSSVSSSDPSGGNRVQVGQGFYGPKFSGNVFTSPDASLAQAESLKIAQARIMELEKLIDRLRYENEELASAGEVVRTRLGEMNAKVSILETEKKEIKEAYQAEILIVKGNLQYKNDEIGRFRMRIEELEMRLKSDFKKIRVRERELENRLELMRIEKVALLRAKDENILELKKKMEHLQSELENYREKCGELNKAMGENQESLKRTARALRLALASLGITEDEILGLKKAE